MARAIRSPERTTTSCTFRQDGLPPNNAFWSLTMGDARNHFVANPLNRYSVSDRSGLVPNADGSVDIYIQNTAPAGHESNWLPAPSGNFILWLRVYIPGAGHSQRRVQGAAGCQSEMISMNTRAFTDIRCGLCRGMVSLSPTFGRACCCPCTRERSSLKGSATAPSRSIRSIRSPKRFLQIPSTPPASASKCGDYWREPRHAPYGRLVRPQSKGRRSCMCRT